MPDGTKSLKIEEGSKTVLHADLTNHEKVKTIEEEELVQISGKVKHPNNLPDGRKAEEIFLKATIILFLLISQMKKTLIRK